MAIAIAPLSHADPDCIETLLDLAFGADRHGRTAYRIREGTTAVPSLSFAAFDGATLVGTLQSWPVQIRQAHLTLVGPVAVLPSAQRRGIGRLLMAALIDAAPDEPMAMIGDPEYYGRFFGFTAAATSTWDVPGPVDRRRLLARNTNRLPGTGLLGPRVFALAEPKA